MEITTELQFKHYTLREVQLPADAFASLPAVDLDRVSICCDLDRHVFFAEHTDPEVAQALRLSHWMDLREWTEHASGGADRMNHGGASAA
jgi:hypothetical protein